MIKEDRYSVKQLARLAGVSTRTLRFYDQKGLLIPDGRADNGYRFYTRDSLLRLQQILFLRELRFNLEQISTILDDPKFDLPSALDAHERNLQAEINRMNQLVMTIRKTRLNLKGEAQMAPEEYFNGISEEKQKEYQEYIEKRYDPKLVQESNRRYSKLSEGEKQALVDQGESITREIVAAIPFGTSSPQAQEAVDHWYQHINQFYPCSLEIFNGLGQLYLEHPDFTAHYQKYHASMPQFLTEAMSIYCRNRGYEPQS